MIQKPQIEDLAKLANLLGHLDVSLARQRLSRRVIMHKHKSLRPVLYDRSDDFAKGPPREVSHAFANHIMRNISSIEIEKNLDEPLIPQPTESLGDQS